LNSSVAEIYALIKGQKSASAAPPGNSNWIDVRDLAKAHVECLTNERAGGERLIIGFGESFGTILSPITALKVGPPYVGPYTWQDFLDAIHTDPTFSSLPKGTPGSGKNVMHPILMDTTKAQTILGLKYRGLGESAKDTVRSLLEREKSSGW